MKKCIRILFIIIGVFLIIETSALLLFVSFNLGFAATILLGFLYLIYSLYFEKIKILSRNKLIKWIKNIAVFTNIIMILVIIFISIFGKIDTVTYKEDVVIVLGAGINGEVITAPLLYRLEKSVEYFNKNSNSIIIVSGGQGYNESITEALAMERYLISKGIPKSKILKEEKSTSTYENFIFSKRILDNYFKKEYKTAFITNDFHIFRAKELSKIADVDSTYMHARLQWYIAPVTYVREVMAIIKLVILRQ